MRRIVRTEVKFQRPTDLFPTEIAWHDDGTWTIPDFHLGRWTERTAAPGETAEQQQHTGGRITRDELHADVCETAIQRDWTPRRTAPPLSLLMGNVEATTGTLAPSEALILTEHALAAVAWLNEHAAPKGRRFVLVDALYLIREDDPNAPP